MVCCGDCIWEAGQGSPKAVACAAQSLYSVASATSAPSDCSLGLRLPLPALGPGKMQRW